MHDAKVAEAPYRRGSAKTQIFHKLAVVFLNRGGDFLTPLVMPFVEITTKGFQSLSVQLDQRFDLRSNIGTGLLPVLRRSGRVGGHTRVRPKNVIPFQTGRFIPPSRQCSTCNRSLFWFHATPALPFQ